MLTIEPFDSVWYAAVSLSERFASLRAAGGVQPDAGIDRELGRRRLRQWRVAAPLAPDAALQRRLVADGMTMAEFVHLLGEPLTAVRDRFVEPPWWLNRLGRAFARPGSPTSLPDSLLAGLDDDTRSMLGAVAPLIADGLERLHGGVRGLSRTQLPFESTAVEDALRADLDAQLSTLLQPSLGQTNEATPALLREYPVLARLVVECIEQWVAYSLTFLSHLCEDWDALRQTLCDGDPGALTGLVGSAGDRHRGGKTVQVAGFSSGLRLIYKPRTLALDVHFQELLDWLNGVGVEHPFRTLRVLDRGTHGWSGFVPAGGCTSVEEVERFYHRMGAYLALLYGLAGADMHNDNVIAAGEHPVLVDLETLFCPSMERFALHEADSAARSWLASSVLPIGLLPMALWQTATFDGVDISAIGGAPAESMPGYDDGAGKPPAAGFFRPRNRPTLNGIDIDPAAYLGHVTAGFGELYELLQRHRSRFLAGDGPVARFARDETRLLVRPTETYATLLGRGRNSSVLRNAIYRDCLFDGLWSEVDDRPYLARVIAAEQNDLRRGDVPLFTTMPASRDLWTSDGSRLPDFVEEPALALIHRRISRFSKDDRERQEWAVRAAFTALPGSAGRLPSRPHAAEPPAAAGHRQLLAAARAIGDRLEALSVCGADDACWVGLSGADGRTPTVMVTGTDLYSGLPGIALFLAYLGDVCRDERYTRLARGALRTLRRQVNRYRSAIASIGALEGWGGIIYTLAHLAALWREPALLDEAESLVPWAFERIKQDEQLHIAGGAAGCILALTALHGQTRSRLALAASVACGNHILELARPAAAGIAWLPAGAAHGAPLTGMAYGAAGIAYALLQSAGICGDERFRAVALEAMTYARSQFRPDEGNQPRFQTTWCHGAPGIGLARLCSLPYVDNAAIREEIDAALAATLATGFGRDHSLCHGDLGSLDLLLTAANALDQPSLRSQVEHIVAGILDGATAHGWLCGVPYGVETPGLMTGLAGMGYGLLRAAAPARLPSVLVLAPPHRADSQSV